MSTGFSGRTALVTGSTSGIGAAVATQLAVAGAHVVVSGRGKERGDAVVAAIRSAGGSADFVAADLGTAEGARSLAAEASAVTGQVDVLVNNAGTAVFGPSAGVSDEELDAVLALNIRAPYVLVSALAPGMAERGRGSVVSVTTMVAGFGNAGMAAYGASKAALELLTKSWAAEFGPAGVRFNAVAPGPTRTEMTAGMGEALDQLAASTPLGRVATPDQIADAIVFLASDAASNVHGAILPVDGGRRAV